MIRTFIRLACAAVLCCVFSPSTRADPPTGACCLVNAAGAVTCQIGTQGGCNQLRGNYRGNGTACTATGGCPALPPPPTGACCVTANGATTCSVISAAACRQALGNYRGDNIACGANNTCPPHGACCFPSGFCRNQLQQVCTSEGGTWQTAGSVCYPNPCPQPPHGACCIEWFDHAYCVVLTSAHCTNLHGTYQGDNVACTTTTCPQPIVGACCIAATATSGPSCFVKSQARCTAHSGTFGGAGSTCLSANCPTTCPCDYNHDGLLTPADFYAFFDAWLAGNGDFNHSGATDSQDLIDFATCFRDAPTGCTRGR
jgi:hypothetical protein